MKTKDFEISIKAAEEDVPSITAYASTFDRDPDCYGDVVAKGAFVESLKKWEESGNSIPLLFGHRTDDPMMNIGRVTKACEDERGLLIEAEFDMENPNAVKAHRDVLARTLTKLSFAFDLLEAGPVELENGVKANELRKMDIFEVSLVPIPANQHTEVIAAKDGEADAKAGRRNSAKDEEELARVEEMARGIIEVIRGLTAAEDNGSDGGGEGSQGKGAKEPTKGRNDEAEEILKRITYCLENN